MGEQHPLTAGVTVIVTRHLGPYKKVLRAPFSLWQAGERLTIWEAAERSAARDRRHAALGRVSIRQPRRLDDTQALDP